MPASGAQHTSITNPFSEPQQRISEYTAQEIATLQSRLEKQLGPEYLSSRSGPSGQKVHYITADKCIALANEVFGFNGWSSSIQNIQVDFVDENPQTLKISLGLSVIVRVTLRDGTFHEDLGYGHIENCRGKAAAFEKAKKEGTTDALKRALRHFGNVLGNCIYDKSYLAKVTKVKVAPTKFDEYGLHRHADFVKKEPVESEVLSIESSKPPPQMPTADSFEDFLGELDEADFNISEEGHPDEVVLPNSNYTDSNQGNLSDKNRGQPTSKGNNPMQPPARPLVRTGSTGNNPPRQPPQTPVQQAPRPNINAFPGAQNRGPPGGARPPQQQFNQNQNQNQNRPAAQPHPNANANANPNPQTHMTPPPAAAPSDGEIIGFFSAKAVTVVGEAAGVSKTGQTFNPRLESPSIRKTPGIDHTKSKPLTRTGQHVPPPSQADDDDKTENSNGAVASAGLSAGINKPGGQQQQQQQQPPRPVPGHGLGRPGNMVNPQLDHTRRIGAPGSSSPLGNRGQYRPLTVKRPAAGGDGAGNGAGNGAGAGAGAGVGVGGGQGGRTALTDVSNAPVNGNVVGGGGDFKRQRTS